MMIVMRKHLLAALALLLAGTTPLVQSESSTCDNVETAPFVAARTMHRGVVVVVDEQQLNDDYDDMLSLADVTACCVPEPSSSSEKEEVYKPQVIGKMPQFSTEQTLAILQEAKEAWNGGSGTWPQMSLQDRIRAVEKFLLLLNKRREDIVQVLMWEIGKTKKDAASEFDRTVQFAQETIKVLQTNSEYAAASWQSIIGSTTRALVRRAAIGIILCLGPFNYPINETYATLLPALLMGNVVIMKIPTVGGLAHLLTMEAFCQALPPGAINFVSGSGRATMPPLMASGTIDGLAFIGGSAAADHLIKQHPHPHRLKVFLQLEAKNMGIFLPNLFSQKDLLETALDEAVLGSLSFNGQRCTALKLLFVPAEHAEAFAHKMAKRVEAMRVGLPWQQQTWDDNNDGQYYAQITPLPNQGRVDYMKRLIDEAISKGAKVLNANGGTVVGGPESTLMVPAVLYPVTPDMDIYHEEQFGPIVPIAPYDDIETVLAYGRDGEYGQQCSIFTAQADASVATTLVDRFSSVFGKININSQCGRSPDSLPFSGRRSSAMGVMSVSDALREFSIPTVISYKEKGENAQIVEDIQKGSSFMEEKSVAASTE